MSRRVLVVDSAEVFHAPDVELEREVLGSAASVELVRVDREEELLSRVAEASALIVWHHLKVTRAVIRECRRLRIIVRNGVGFDNVDVRAAAEFGIPVANVPDYGPEEVADHTMALVLALTRQLRPLTEDIARGNWRYQAGEDCRRVRGQIFGVVGCGRIGTAVALRARAFGYQVTFYDPYLPPGYEKAIGTRREHSLDDLLEIADVVSLHAPLTDETYHMIAEPQLRRMKRTAFLINTARGPIVEHRALERALAERWIAGAGLDVLEHEPRGLDLYLKFANCIVTPHSAFYSRESMVEMRRTSASIVRDALLDGIYRNIVNGVQPPQPPLSPADRELLHEGRN
jgi:phosphoglycerate dehydrogenase-like enzyme